MGQGSEGLGGPFNTLEFGFSGSTGLRKWFQGSRGSRVWGFGFSGCSSVTGSPAEGCGEPRSRVLGDAFKQNSPKRACLHRGLLLYFHLV